MWDLSAVPNRVCLFFIAASAPGYVEAYLAKRVDRVLFKAVNDMEIPFGHFERRVA